LIDGEGRPIAGAKVRIKMFGKPSDSGSDGRGGRYIYNALSFLRADIEGIPQLEQVFETVTSPDGSFTLRETRENSWVKLGVTTPDGNVMNVRAEKVDDGPVGATMARDGFVQSSAGEPARLIAYAAAKVQGQVVTKLTDVPTANLRIQYEESHPPGTKSQRANVAMPNITTGTDGRFVIDGMYDGTVNIFVYGKGEGKTWTYAAAKDVALKSGETADVTIELIRGVEVEGTVVDKATGKPVEGAEMGVYGPFRPHTSGMTRGSKTGADGRYHYLLPPGETLLYVMGPPAGYLPLPGHVSDQTVTIPEDAVRFTVPPLEVVPAVVLKGRVINLNAQPMPSVTIIDAWHGGMRQVNKDSRKDPLKVVTNAKGEFQLPASYNTTVQVGESAQVRVRLADGTEHELTAFPIENGSFRVVVPVKTR
jgi:hypothetical protein